MSSVGCMLFTNFLIAYLLNYEDLFMSRLCNIGMGILCYYNIYKSYEMVQKDRQCNIDEHV